MKDFSLSQNKKNQTKTGGMRSKKLSDFTEKVERRNKSIQDQRFQEITNLFNDEVNRKDRIDNRDVVAEEVKMFISNTKIAKNVGYKTYHHGDSITYLDIVKYEIKVGRVKISQGRNEAITLCFERFDNNGSRYIKLYTHKELMRKNKSNQNKIICNFSDYIYSKYLN